MPWKEERQKQSGLLQKIVKVFTSIPGHLTVGEKEGILRIDVTTKSSPEDANKMLIEYCQQELNKNVTPNEFESQEAALAMDEIFETFFSMKLACYRRLTFPSPSSTTSPLSPGLFTGQFSAHGTEMILVQLGEEGTYLRGIKVTGDPNVPFNQVTFDVEDSRCLSIPQEDQASCKGVLDCQNYISYEVNADTVR